MASQTDNRGFTLLEVLIAVTVVGLTIGSLFGLLAGSKRLAWRAKGAIQHAMAAGAVLNAVSLQVEGALLSALPTDVIVSVTTQEIPVPERQTKESSQFLVMKSVEVAGIDFKTAVWQRREPGKEASL